MKKRRETDGTFFSCRFLKWDSHKKLSNRKLTIWDRKNWELALFRLFTSLYWWLLNLWVDCVLDKFNLTTRLGIQYYTFSYFKKRKLKQDKGTKERVKILCIYVFDGRKLGYFHLKPIIFLRFEKFFPLFL